jgi:hypothetical protein
MRRSSVVRLTLLPLLATAAVASAQPGPDEPLSPPGMSPSGMSPSEASPLGLSPPGLTPTIDELDCDHDPNWQLRDDCAIDDNGNPIIVRQGFGAYFWTGGG